METLHPMLYITSINHYRPRTSSGGGRGQVGRGHASHAPPQSHGQVGREPAPTLQKNLSDAGRITFRHLKRGIALWC